MTGRKSCKFCEDYTFAMSHKKDFNDQGMHHHLRVCLCERGTKDRKLVLRHMFNARQLNYCPTCGTKLKRGY